MMIHNLPNQIIRQAVVNHVKNIEKNYTNAIVSDFKFLQTYHQDELKVIYLDMNPTEKQAWDQKINDLFVSNQNYTDLIKQFCKTTTCYPNFQVTKLSELNACSLDIYKTIGGLEGFFSDSFTKYFPVDYTAQTILKGVPGDGVSGNYCVPDRSNINNAFCGITTNLNDVKGTSLINAVQILYFVIIGTSENKALPQILSDMILHQRSNTQPGNLEQYQHYDPYYTPLIQGVDIPSSLQQDLSQFFFSNFTELFVPSLGYEWGGDRYNNPKYASKTLTGQDCSSLVSHIFHSSYAFTTRDMYTAYKNECTTKACEAVLKVMTPNQNTTNIEPGDIFVLIKGHTGIIINSTASDNDGKLFLNIIDTNRDIAKMEGIGYSYNYTRCNSIEIDENPCVFFKPNFDSISIEYIESLLDIEQYTLFNTEQYSHETLQHQDL